MSTITMTDIDPGEGSPLQSDNFLAVYGGKSLLDVFYPVGTYYETSDTDFDPNVTWGGVWEEDTRGRVTVAQASSGTFDTVGAAGGQESVTLSASIGAGLGESQTLAYIAENVTAYMLPRRYSYKVIGTGSQSGGEWSHSTPVTETSKNERTTTILQPYIVVKRWHRIS